MGDVGTVTSKFGSAFSFDGDADYIEIADSNDFDVIDGGSFTVCAWLYKANNAEEYILQKGREFKVFYSGSGRWQVSVGLSYVYVPDATPQNKWVCLGVVYDGSTVTIYIDGVNSQSGSVSGFRENHYPLHIGADTNGDSEWTGLIDDVLWFNRALSASEMAALYDATSANMTASIGNLTEMVVHNYTVHAINAAGEHTSQAGQIMVDVPDSAPTGTITSPISLRRSSSSNQTFTANVQDTNADTTLAIATLYWDYGQEFGVTAHADFLSGDSDTVSISVSDVSNGTITWNLYVEDSDGNGGFIAENQTLFVGQDAYYIAPNGSDEAAGTIDAPFATIQHFADIAYPGDTCYIRAGTYRETVTPARSGNADANITYAAYNGERAIISGADPVSLGWQVHTGHIYKTTTMNCDLGRGKNQVFVDGTAAMEARWPNCEDVMQPALLDIDSGSYVYEEGDYIVTLNGSNLVQEADFWVGGTVHAIWGRRYYAQTGLITDSEPGTLTMTLDCSPASGGMSNGVYYITGCRNALDAAGEWWYDGSTDTLYLWTPNSDSPSAHVVEAKAREHAFVLDGLSYLSIENVHVFAANVTTDEDSSHITIQGMDAEYLSHYTVIGEETSSGGDNGLLTTGIVLDGDHHVLQNSVISYSAGNCVSLLGDDCIVRNCDISKANYTLTGCAVVHMGSRETKNNRIEYNTLYHAGRSVIEHSYAKGLKVLHNEMYGARRGGESWDLGTMYAIATDGQATEVAYNHIHDSRGDGIYLDNYNHNFIIHHNIIDKTSTGTGTYYNSILLNTPTRDNQVYHNTALWTIRVNGATPASGIIIKNNIMRDLYYDRGSYPPPGGEVDFQNNIEFLLTHPHEDPNDVFRDYPGGNYRLKAGSPAIDAGVNVGYVQDIVGNPIVGAPDIGAYEYTSGATTYTLSVSVTNGAVTRTPDKTSYTAGETVTLEAIPAVGYSFVSWSGDVTGGSNPASVVMIGDKVITANFSANVYALSVAASGGSVTKSPDKASYDYGEAVILTAVADAGYSFSGWSGDASGTTNPVTITMDGDKSVTAGFTANSYALAVAATNGSVMAVPQKDSYLYGETVSLQAAASVGYHFTGWSGDLSGSANPSSIVMNGNKSVTAGFAINTYTLSATAVNGSVVKSPEQASYTHGETVSLTATADSGYEFSGWSGAISGSVNPASVVMDSDKSVTASFSAVGPDQDPPVLYSSSPAADAIQVPLNSLVVLQVADEGEGVDANTVTIAVNGETVYAGNVTSYSSATGVCRRVGTRATYTYAYQPAEDFDFDDAVTVTVNAADLEGNVMNPQSYSFQTQMRAFGSNRCASWGPDGLDKAGPATVCDASGNVWAVWHVGVAGVAGGQGIHLSRRAAGAEQFDAPVPLTTVVANQYNPSIAVGADGKLYVVWQDNRRGNWDIYVSTSADGATWSAAAQVTDSDNDEINPVVAVDGQSPHWAYVAWQDNRSGNQDIYVASSSNGFATKTAVCVASNAQDQIDPAIAIDASNTVYLVWTDYRNGSADIYGAASNEGPWTNVAVAIGAGNQSAPAIAAAPTGSVLHFAWVSDAAGDDDICYGFSSGLPISPLAAMEIVDDSSAADQEAPALVVAEGPRVFVCWQDARNALNGWDIDLYMVEVREGGETNLLVGDGGTSSNQRQPAVGLDLYGRPYVVWSDDRNTTDEIYFAASTFVEPTPLAESIVTGGTGGTVGTVAPAAVDDVSVVIPAGACPYDVTVSVAKIQNLQPDLAADILPYEFGPSGLQFDVPVTITIPYAVADYGSTLPQPYWYDSLTGTMTQEGVTNVEHVALSSTIHALRFQTTHFTPYALVAAADGEVPAAGGGGGGGGGGCSLSPVCGGSGAVEFFIPFVLLAAAVIALWLRDAKRCRE